MENIQMKAGSRLQVFEGFQTQSRTVEALPIRIDYQSPREEYSMRAVGRDWRFSFDWKFKKVREMANLDPYAIREAFDRVETAEQALRFVSESGKFWPFQRVLWSQFREWQSFFRWLRLQPQEAKRSSEGKRAWDTAASFQNSFFAQTDADFTRSRFPESVIKEMGAENWRKNQNRDRGILGHLRRFALHPERDGEGSQVSLGWYDPKLKLPPEDWRARKGKSAEGVTLAPFLRIEALNVIEAIAATIYADRLNGTRFRKCKHCGRLFKVESDHDQSFCPAPLHLKSSPCKNAYFQHERRSNERRTIELMVQGWRDGSNDSQIRKKLVEQDLPDSEQLRAKARRVFQRDQRLSKKG